ncbi:MAG: hypothetical protein AB7O84_21825 [Planctomycetota bacterium]
MVIPLPQAPAGTDRAVREFYESMFARLQQAHQEGDLPALRSMVATFLRDDAPDWARQRLLGFRALQHGLQFEQHARRATELVPSPAPAAQDAAAGEHGPDCIGVPLRYELVLPTPPDGPWLLGGRDDRDPLAFRFSMLVLDHFVDGSSREHKAAEVVRLERGFELGGAPLRLPLQVDLGDTAAVRRELSLRIDLLPGYVQHGEDRAPVRTTTLCTALATQWPPGHAAIRRDPLLALRAAMQRGDREHFAHVRLAAEFAPAAQRVEVLGLLIDWVRLGRRDQALVATAALRAVTGADVAVGDRDGWLAWWQAQR